MRAKALGKGYLAESKNPKKRFDQTGEVGEAFPGERVLSPIGLWELAYGGFDTTWEKSTVILAQAALYIVSLIAGRKSSFFIMLYTHSLFYFTSLASFDIPNHNIK